MKLNFNIRSFLFHRLLAML